VLRFRIRLIGMQERNSLGRFGIASRSSRSKTRRRRRFLSACCLRTTVAIGSGGALRVRFRWGNLCGLIHERRERGVLLIWRKREDLGLYLCVLFWLDPLGREHWLRNEIHRRVGGHPDRPQLHDASGHITNDYRLRLRLLLFEILMA